MTVDSTPTGIVYTVTSGAAGAEYPLTFPYIDPEDIRAYHATSRAPTYLVYGADYTVAGQTLTTMTELPVGAALAVYRETPVTQEILWVDGQAVYTPDIMRADDKLTLILQEMIDAVSRAVKISREDAAQGMTPEDLLAEIFGARDEAQAAQTGAEAALTAAERCRDEACECAGEAEEAAENAAEATAGEIREEMSGYAQDAASSLTQINAVFDELQNLPAGQRLPVMQIDPTTETLTPEPHGVDPASVADAVDGLTLDIAQGDYALVLTDETVDADGEPHAAVALYRGVGADAGNYTGVFAKVVEDSGPIVPTYALASRMPATPGSLTELDVNYVNWSVGELPQADVAEGALALVQGEHQEQYKLFRRESGQWARKYTGNTFFAAVSEARFIVVNAVVDAFGTGPNYAVMGLNAWVPVTVTDPATPPVTLPVSDTPGDGIVCQGETIGGGYPEWEFVKNLPVDNLDLFGVTKPLDPDSRIWVWFRDAWVPWGSRAVSGDGNADGLPVLAQFRADYTPNGCLSLEVNHGQLSRAVYPEAWARIESIGQTSPEKVQDDAAWLETLETQGWNGNYSSGDGETTFRVPYYPDGWSGFTPPLGASQTKIADFSSIGSTSTTFYSAIVPYDAYVRAAMNTHPGEGGAHIYVNNVLVDRFRAFAKAEYNLYCYAQKGATLKINGWNIESTTDQDGLGLFLTPTLQLPPLHIKLYAVPPTVEQDQLQTVTQAQASMVHVGSSWGMPDYSQAVTVHVTTAPGVQWDAFTIDKDCMVIAGLEFSDSTMADVWIGTNGIIVARGRDLTSAGTTLAVIASGLFKKDDTVIIKSNYNGTRIKQYYSIIPLIKDSGQTAAIPSVQEYVDERINAFPVPKIWGTVSAQGTLLKGGGVSSVSRTGTGIYLITFQSAMPDANYMVSSAGVDCPQTFAKSQEAGSMVLYTTDSAGNPRDPIGGLFSFIVYEIS
ncbi:MAG: hypothetical protein LBQ10_03835 [Desulfovibrio sp.]|jgi:hypothetical protein|nr:hypothetical protein [Desulfovibrio sp.]